ncbi:MAG TPA: D-alanyl-D-alanine dipeptidase, partial [Rhodocyclaceae bacterium]|nr:D-alanyl-D-alanine dipeptidase [Rhodocyclaceae bacterium]
MDAKAYAHVPIADCGEPLVAVPAAFGFCEPHAYRVLGAPYGEASPWLLRRGVAAALLEAQAQLAARRPGWRLKLFDAYRPVAVQRFMVWREFERQAEVVGRSLAGFAGTEDLAGREPRLYAELAATVFTFWGVPSDDPRTPPPHSTGAA